MARSESAAARAAGAQAVSALRDLLYAGDSARRSFADDLGIGMTESWALSHLYAHGELGQAELARALHINTSSMTSLVDRLESVGFAERVPHPTDRRRSIVRLTTVGRRRVAGGRKYFQRAFDQLPVDLETATELLQALGSNLLAQGRRPTPITPPAQA